MTDEETATATVSEDEPLPKYLGEIKPLVVINNYGTKGAHFSGKHFF